MRTTPLPTPPPQGGREHTEFAACAQSTSRECAPNSTDQDCFNSPLQTQSINFLSRVLHVLERGDDLAGDLAVLLDHLADVDVLDRIVGDRVHAERSARSVELHL